MLPRESKVKTMQEAAALIPDGARITLGGFGIYQHPMAFIHELIRQGRTNLTLVGKTNGNDADILAAAGVISRVETCHVGLERFGLAQNFRRAVESGALDVVDYPEILANDRFLANEHNLSFWPSFYLGGTDIPTYNSDIKEATCALTGRRFWAVPPANPDYVIVHALMADEFGNVYFPQRRTSMHWADITFARACDNVIVTVEKIVRSSHLRRYPDTIEIPAFRTAMVVEAPYGAHPCQMTGAYTTDEIHFHEYVEASRNDAAFSTYLHTYVRGTANHTEYLERIGLGRLLELREMEVVQ